MRKEFQGHVVLGGDVQGKAMVSRKGFNSCASYISGLASASPLSHDQDNKELYKKPIAGSILCLPTTIGSSTGGMVLQAAARIGIAPKAMLYADNVDTVSVAGILLADIWDGKRIICLDRLGRDFLNQVKEGDTITIKSDGKVIVERA